MDNIGLYFVFIVLGIIVGFSLCFLWFRRIIGNFKLKVYRNIERELQNEIKLNYSDIVFFYEMEYPKASITIRHKIKPAIQLNFKNQNEYEKMVNQLKNFLWDFQQKSDNLDDLLYGEARKLKG